MSKTVAIMVEGRPTYFHIQKPRRRRASVGEICRRFAELERMRTARSGWCFIMHPNLFHRLKYGNLHADCLWWRRWTDVR